MTNISASANHLVGKNPGETLDNVSEVLLLLSHQLEQKKQLAVMMGRPGKDYLSDRHLITTYHSLVHALQRARAQQSSGEWVQKVLVDIISLDGDLSNLD